MNETGEGKLRFQTGGLFVFSFLTASTYVFVRALAVSLFLARAGSENLPIAFAASALVVVAVSLLTRHFVKLVPTPLAASITWIVLAAVTVTMGFTLGSSHHSVVALSALYVFAEIRGCLNTVYGVTLANEAFADSDSKRHYAIVASGAPVAGILVGVVLGFESSAVLLMPALCVIAALDIMTSITVWLLRSNHGGRKSHVVSAQRLSREIERTQKAIPRRVYSQYQLHLAALVSLKIVVLTLIGYQWKVAAGNYFGSNESQLLAYFAIFYAVSDVLIVLLQWLVSGKLMDRVGIGVGLIGFPIAILAVGLIAFFVDTIVALLVVFTLGKGLNVLRRSLHDPGLSVAYSAIDHESRPESIVFVKGIVKPFAEAVSALLLLFVGGVVFEVWITAIWFVIAIPWLYCAFKVTELYQREKRSVTSRSVPRIRRLKTTTNPLH